MACPRVTYRRRMHYATRGNRMKFVRTPGNRLVFQKRGKRSQGPHCPWVLGHKRLAGTKALGHFERAHKAGYGNHVSRPYGGVLTHEQVRDRIVRAFLLEEQRIVRKVVQAEKRYKSSKKREDIKKKKRLLRIKAKEAAKTATKPLLGAAKIGAAKKGVTTAAHGKGAKTVSKPGGAGKAGHPTATAAAAAASKTTGKATGKATGKTTGKTTGKSSVTTQGSKNVPVGAKLVVEGKKKR